MKIRILALAIMLCTTALQATDGLYLGVKGGLNIPNPSKFKGELPDETDFKLAIKKGYDVSGSIGYKWFNGFRTEGEVAYRRNNLGDVKVVDEFDTEHSIHSNFNTISVMGNLYYDIDLNCGITPYVGGGLGYARMQYRLDADDASSFSVESESEIARQAMAGVELALSECAAVGIEYKFFRPANSKLENHSVGLSLKYFF